MIDRICSLLKMKKPALTTGLLFSSGSTVPSDGASGYQTGCIFQHTDGGAGTSFYLNEGDSSSADFNAIGGGSGAETLAALSDVGATAYTAGKILVADGNSYEEVAVSGDATLASTGALSLAALSVDTAELAAGAVETSKINDGAVTAAKVEGLAAGQFVVGVDGSAANNAKVVMSGDATLSSAGALTIAAGAVEDSMLEGLNSGAFFIGTNGTAAGNAKVTMSGDATMANNGAVTIAALAVETAMIAGGAVTADKIEGLTAGQIVLGVDGTAANNAKAVLSGDVTMDATGAVTIAEGAVEDSMIEGLTAGQIILGVDGAAANNIKAVLSGDVTMDATGAVTIAGGAVEDSMIEGLAAGAFIVGTDGTAENNAKVTMGGHATMDGTGAVTLATATKTYAIALTDLRQENAGKDLLPDTPDGDGGTLGLADAIGSPVVGTTTNNTAATEKCAFDYVVPADYVAGQDLTVRVKAFCSAARQAESLLDVVAKLVKSGGLDATDLCLTAATDLKAVVAEANQDFVIDNDAVGDELAPGSVLHIEISFETDDTDGGTPGYGQINGIDVLVPCYR